jgi:hypothetical protein
MVFELYLLAFTTSSIHEIWFATRMKLTVPVFFFPQRNAAKKCNLKNLPASLPAYIPSKECAELTTAVTAAPTGVYFIIYVNISGSK